MAKYEGGGLKKTVTVLTCDGATAAHREVINDEKPSSNSLVENVW